MESKEKTLQERWAELVVAGLFALTGLVVINDSFRTGFKWAAEGPQPGYFPFYIGLILIGGALYVAFQTLKSWVKDGGEASFATYEEFGLMLKMLIPTIVYVTVLVFAGLYAASVLFIAGFMVWQGKYSYLKSAIVGLVVAFVIMLFFEVIFQVALPKNPLDEMLVSQLAQAYATVKGMF